MLLRLIIIIIKHKSDLNSLLSVVAQGKTLPHGFLQVHSQFMTLKSVGDEIGDVGGATTFDGCDEQVPQSFDPRAEPLTPLHRAPSRSR